MNIKTSTVAKIIIFSILAIMAVKLCADLKVYISDNINQIREEKKYAEYKKQQEEERLLHLEIESAIRHNEEQKRRRYYY